MPIRTDQGTRRFNVAPTEEVLAIVAPHGEPEARLLRWGLVPLWATDLKGAARMINARMETVASTPAYGTLIPKGSHCALQIADGYYEWLKPEKRGESRQPFLFQADAPVRRLACSARLRQAHSIVPTPRTRTHVMRRPTTHSLRVVQGQRRPLRCVLVGCAIMNVAAFVLAPTAAAAVGAPLISEGAAWEVGSEVLVGAHINPEGLETTYEIQVECPDHALCQATTGQLPAVDEARAVHLALSEPQRGGTYIFTVTAHNTDGKASASWKFQVPELIAPETPPGAAPNGSMVTETYTPPELPWANQSGNEAAARTVAEQRAKEQAEQQAREAAASREAEAEALKHVEEAAQTAAATRRREEAKHPACTVPALKGDTLSAARRALLKVHCRLGRVSRPRRRRGQLVVTRQSPQRGRTLPAGAAVTVTFAPR